MFEKKKAHIYHETYRDSLNLNEEDKQTPTASGDLLVAHANPIELEFLASGLEKAGFCVRTTGNALSCLKKLKTRAPTTLLLDPLLLWGGADGIVELMRIDPNLRSVPVILITSNAEGDEMADRMSFRVHSTMELHAPIDLIVHRCHELASACQTI